MHTDYIMYKRITHIRIYYVFNHIIYIEHSDVVLYLKRTEAEVAGRRMLYYKLQEQC